MKKTFLLLFLSLFLELFFAKNTQACDWNQCHTETDCSLSACSDCSICQTELDFCDQPVCKTTYSCEGVCSACGWCPSGENPSEDITGKISNPVLPHTLSTIPGALYLSKILKTGVSLVLIVGIVIFFFIFTSGGVKWLSSSGDKSKLESAQKQISSGLVGLVILLSAFAIIKLIETLFGIDLLNITLPTL